MKAWLLTMTGALAWFASLCISFATVPPACSNRSKPMLLIIPILAILLTFLAGLISWRRWRAMGGEFPAEASEGGSRAMASGGVLLNGFFIIVLVAQMLSPAFLGVCE